jgi:flagellar basal-body rod protein FlgG
VQIPDTPNPVVVMPDGNVLVDNQQVAAIDIVTADPKSLQKLGGNFFTGQNKTAPVTAPAQPDQTKVYQGFLEKPNVQVVTEMVSMIETQRSFEAYAKILTTTQDMDNSAVTKVGSTT